MQPLNDAQNFVLGASAAFVEVMVLQPTLYWKNAAQQGLCDMRFTIDPKVVYRGLGASLLSEMGSMGLQFYLTGFIKRIVSPDGRLGPAGEMAAAMGGGVLGAL